MNLSKILTTIPKGRHFYCTVFGSVCMCGVSDKHFVVEHKQKESRGRFAEIDEFGRFSPKGECIVFPKRGIRTWNNWQTYLVKVGDYVKLTTGEIVKVTQEMANKRDNIECWATDEEIRKYKDDNEIWDLEIYREKCQKFVTMKNQTALSTYIQLGLVEEVGEVTGKVAKYVRQNDTVNIEQMTQEYKEAIAKEFGDVCWFLAMLTTDNVSIKSLQQKLPSDCHFHADVFMLNCNTILRTMLTKTNCTEEILSYIGQMAKCLGYTLDQILKMNIAKLTDRQNRGVINGSGDNR